MEYVKGKNLSQVLDEKGALNSKEVEEITENILKALSYLHNSGLVHRDVKPSNILIDENGNIKLADIGLVKPILGRTITREELFYLTPDYSSPEFYDGKRLTYRSDLYSHGITLYQLLTGRLPFEDEDGFNLLRKHKMEKFPPFPEDLKIPEKMKNFILRLIQKDEKKKPSDGTEALKIFKKKKIKKPLNL